jgi:peptide/nickel transport system substrate-binding protein
MSMEPKRRNIIVVAAVAVLVVAGVGGYFVLSKTSVSATCGPNQRSTICVYSDEVTDSLDPVVGFSSPDWAALQQVYQGPVQYNGTSDVNFSGILAKNWTIIYDSVTGFESYVFHLRAGVHFSNGDPYNAYVQWYSLYRGLLMAQGPQFILEENFYSTNFSTTNPLSYYSNLSAIDAANTTLASDLNSWNFFDPTSSEIALMGEPAQSFQVVNNLTIQLNLGYGYLESNYTYLLATLSSPIASAVDPAWIDANGGITVGAVNDYVTTHPLGTGPFLLENYNPVEGGGYKLVPDPNYWGKAAAATEPWNSNLQPANTTVEYIFQASLDVTISDMLSGNVQSALFAYIGASTLASLRGHSNVVVQPLSTVFASTSGTWWVYLNQTVYPFNNLSVREAIAHAINYTEIIQEAFAGYAQQWVGPVPPGFPYYNPGNLPPYSYNLALAKQEIANSPCANSACAGVKINFEYLDIGADWAETAEFVSTDLAAIGLTINTVPISLPDLYVEQSVSDGKCVASTTANGGPFPMGLEFYTADYISPDDYTQNDAASTASANMCMAGYDNATVDSLVYSAAAESNPVNLTNDYTEMTSLLYSNYSEIWLVVPTQFAVWASDLHGIILNPMGSAMPWVLGQNTLWLS